MSSKARILMCRPDHFEVTYSINPWMDPNGWASKAQSLAFAAKGEWRTLHRTLKALGATVHLVPPEAGLPDLVFTANAGLVDGPRFVVSRFRHQERRGEAKHDADWFAGQGSQVLEIRAEPEICFEGAGDALPFGRSLLAGYRFRSDFKAHSLLAQLLSIPVLSVELVDARFYHLDLTFCPLDGRRAIVNPHAWDRYGRTVVERLVPEPLVLELDEALTFCANSVVIGTNMVMPNCPARVGRVLESWGFDICVSPVTEFMKAGGGVRCLTLALDVRLGRDSSS
jgi:N-dimethylarginine dimethylaminohydrolase